MGRPYSGKTPTYVSGKAPIDFTGSFACAQHSQDNPTEVEILNFINLNPSLGTGPLIWRLCPHKVPPKCMGLCKHGSDSRIWAYVARAVVPTQAKLLQKSVNGNFVQIMNDQALIRHSYITVKESSDFLCTLHWWSIGISGWNNKQCWLINSSTFLQPFF